MAGYRRGATTLCSNPARGAQRAGISASIRHQRAGGTLLLHVQMFSLCRSNPNYRKHRSLQVAHVIHPHIRGQDDVLVVA